MNRKSRPTKQPGPGYEWVRCRTCDGFGEILGRWNQTLGGARTRCPSCFRLGWIEHWIAGSTGRPPGKGDSLLDDGGLPQVQGKPQAEDSRLREEDKDAVHGRPDIPEVLPTEYRGRQSPDEHGGPTAIRRSRVTYHYARGRARTTMCDLTVRTRGDRKRRGQDISPLVLEVGDPIPAGGKLCVICEAIYIGSVHQSPKPEKEALDSGVQSFPIMAGMTVLVGAFVGIFLVFPLLPDAASDLIVELQQRFSGVFGR